MKKYYVYILECVNFSKKINRDIIYYTGYTGDLLRRLAEHKNKSCKSTKRYRGKVSLVYIEIYFKKREAWLREKSIKKLSPEEKEELSKKKIKIICSYCKNLIIIDSRKDKLECKLCGSIKEIRLNKRILDLLY